MTIALVVLIVLLALAAPALAADGVRVIPAGLDWSQGSQIRADVSADIVVFQDLTQLTADLPMWADAKYLGNDSLPIHLDPSLGDATFQWMPKVFVDDGEGDGRVDADDTIYVVWTRSTLAPTALDNSFGLDAEYGFSTARTVYALDAPHGALGSDGDVFFYDSYTHTRVPVCNRSGAEPPFVYTSTMGAVGPAAGLARVVWSDARDNTNPGNDEADLRLYEAFVPGVSLRISARSIRLRSHVHLTASVAPNFAGATVYFQLVSVGKRYGAPFYTPSRLLNAKMTLGSRSTASRTWTPPARGTYHLRVWFVGGTRYSLNGTVPVGKERLVPHVPNGSRVLTLVVR